MKTHEIVGSIILIVIAFLTVVIIANIANNRIDDWATQTCAKYGDCEEVAKTIK